MIYTHLKSLTQSQKAGSLLVHSEVYLLDTALYRALLCCASSVMNAQDCVNRLRSSLLVASEQIASDLAFSQ